MKKNENYSILFFFSSRRRHTRLQGDWSSDVCSSDLFGPRGFDATDPDVLPPDPRAGTLEDLQSALAAAHARGDLVMPYLNVSWWNPQSPTVQQLPAGLSPTGVSVQD